MAAQNRFGDHNLFIAVAEGIEFRAPPDMTITV
jgi:hypothetical protein